MNNYFSSMFGQPASTYLQGQGPLSSYGSNFGFSNNLLLN